MIPAHVGQNDRAGKAGFGPVRWIQASTLARVAALRSGQGYLRWLVEQKWFEGTPRRAAEIILAAHVKSRQGES